MKLLNNGITGWTSIAAGIATLSTPLAFAVSAALASFNNIFAGLADFLGPFITLLTIPMLIAIGRIIMTKHESLQTLGRAIQILGVLGALIDLIQSILFLSGTLALEQSEAWTAIARGLIGIAILTYALVNYKDPELKSSYVWLSIILGLVMSPLLSGLSGVGLDLQGASDAIAQGNTAEISPIVLVLLFIMAPTYLLGWPIWLIWTGRLLLKGKLSIPEQNELLPQTV